MNPRTTMYSMVTTVPSFHHDLLLKRAVSVTCGDLQGAYPNVQAPICAGQTSICTFSNGLQGCCDSLSSCTFYTTCNGAYATDPCADSQCLSCSQSAPYCVKYNFAGDNGEAFQAFSCDGLQLDSLTIYGVATAIPATLTSVSSSTESTVSGTSSSQVSTSSHTASPATTPSSMIMSSSTALPSQNSTPKSHTGAIAGGVIGGVVGFILIGIGAWMVYKGLRNRKRRRSDQQLGEAQQLYNDRSMTSLSQYPYGRT